MTAPFLDLIIILVAAGGFFLIKRYCKDYKSMLDWILVWSALLIILNLITPAWIYAIPWLCAFVYAYISRRKI